MKDLAWLHPDGREIEAGEWPRLPQRAFAFRLCGAAMDDVDARGERVTGDTLAVLMNAEPVAVRFVIPRDDDGEWERLVDTAQETEPEADPLQAGDTVTVEARSLMLLRRVPPAPPLTDVER
jgi:glycogen operon protein